MPIDKSPAINRRIRLVREQCLKLDIQLDKYTAEISWVEHFLETTTCPVVFCHNDIHEGNCLYDRQAKNKRGSRGKKENNLRLIDFEYASYNYKLYDHANHFCEWMFNYDQPNSTTGYIYNINNWPSETQIIYFLKHYCKEAGCEFDKEKMVEEIKKFAMVSHIYWFLWSLVQAKISLIKFDYQVQRSINTTLRLTLLYLVVCIRSFGCLFKNEKPT